jgi:hypothetical protein
MSQIGFFVVCCSANLSQGNENSILDATVAWIGVVTAALRSEIHIGILVEHFDCGGDFFRRPWKDNAGRLDLS